MTVYLDNSATTRPGAAAAETVREAMKSGWYNPSALYKPALEIQKRMEDVRKSCLQAAGAEGCKIVFTSGGTESDNLALLGHMKTRRGPQEVLISSVEHPAVSACAEELRRAGHRVSAIPAGKSGSVDLKALEGMLGPDTALISVMLWHQRVREQQHDRDNQREDTSGLCQRYADQHQSHQRAACLRLTGSTLYRLTCIVTDTDSNADHGYHRNSCTQ